MSLSVVFPVGFVQALSDAASVEDVVGVCATWLPSVLSADRASLTLLEDNELVFRAVSDDNGLLAGQRFDLDNSISGRVARSKEAVILCAPETMGSPAIAALQERGYRTSLMVPMISNGTILGTLNVSALRENAFGSDDAHRAEAVARWIGSQLLIRRFANRMESLAMTDPTTGYANRRAFMTRASDLMAKFVSGGEGFSIVLLDLDHFKQVNDRYGHETGDAVLRTSTEVIAASLAPDQLLGRVGGEEFALLLPGMPIGGAAELANACREALLDAAFHSGDQRFHVTASFGCSDARNGDAGIDDVLRRADAALYEAKNSGRNRVHRAA